MKLPDALGEVRGISIYTDYYNRLDYHSLFCQFTRAQKTNKKASFKIICEKITHRQLISKTKLAYY